MHDEHQQKSHGTLEGGHNCSNEVVGSSNVTNVKIIQIIIITIIIKQIKKEV